ncbi:MAG: amidohydrolase family protein, partial [Candidatus Woesearchaeota archaeon]
MLQLKNANIISLESYDKIFKDTDLIIKDKKVYDISKKEYNCKCIDLNKDIILPGFIDNHFHSMDLFLNGHLENKTLHETTHSELWRWLQENITGDESYISSLKAYYDSLNGGVTFIHDFSYYKENHGLIKAFKESQLNGLIALQDIDMIKKKVRKFDFDKKLNYSILIPEEDHLDNSYFEFVKNFINKDIITTMHIAETKFRVNSIDFNIINYLNKYGIIDNSTFVPTHGIYLKNRDLDRIVPTIKSEYKLDDGKFDFNKFELVGLGTDGPFWSDGNIIDEMKFRKKEYDLESYEILRQATYNNAKILGLEDDIGTISEGKYADFLVIDKKVIEGSNDIYGNIIENINPDLIKDVYIKGK